MDRQAIIREVKKAESEMITWRRDLHRLPEIGFNLYETTAYLQERLSEMGIPYQPVAETGIVAMIDGACPGPTTAFRADMDALPLAEETGLSFAAENNNMHACGHDAHMAILLAAAKVLSQNQAAIRGRVKLIFQPGEEGHDGAAAMIKAGCLDNPLVDSIYGLHVGQIFPEVKTGQIGLRDGAILAASTAFEVEVEGESAHGAMPHLGVDSILVAAEMIVGLQKVAGREIDPLHPFVLTVGEISGGSALNIISPHVKFRGDFRTIYEEDRQLVMRRLEKICTSTAAAGRAKAYVRLLGGYPATLSDSKHVSLVREAAHLFIGKENTIELKQANMGTEDMSLYLQRVPGAYFILGTGNQDKGIIYPHHHPRFDIDEEALWIGPAVFCSLVFRDAGTELN